MADEKTPFTPFSTDERKEFGKQFTTKEKTSYYKGKQNAYSHAANMAKRQSIFVHGNLNKDTTKAPNTANAKPPKNTGKK